MEKKQFTEVIMFFEDCRIEGKIYTWGEYSKGRLSDVINDGKKFISVVDTKTFSHEIGNAASKLLSNEPLIIVNLDYVKRIVLKQK